MGTRANGITKLVLVVFVFFALTALADWPSDPDTNLALSTTTGEATITRIAATSDGGCYVGWWDNTPGYYCFYLQYLDKDGRVRWSPNGLLISNHTQDTWLTDYSISVDNSDCAILAINDIRAGGDFDIYGYRIDTTGAFLWGRDGLTLSDNTGLDAGQHIAITSLGNIAFAWQEDTVVHVRKVSPAGNDLWDPPVKNLTAPYGYSVPDIAPADNDGVIVQFLIAQGAGMYAPKHLYAHKYDAAGADLWGANGTLVTDAGGFGFQMRPRVMSDGAGGVFSYWYDSRSNVLHAYAQHIQVDGNCQWTTNGVVVSTTFGELQMSPAFVYHPATGDVMLFYENTNSDQTVQGVYGQKLDSNGVRQWGNGGIVLAAMNTQARMLINACAVQNDAVVTYLETPDGDYSNSRVIAIRIDTNGLPAWDPSTVTMTTTLSPKGYLNACVSSYGQVIAAWQDKRFDPDGDVYLQNVNPDGGFGPLPVPLGYIAGLVTGPDESTPLEAVVVTTYDSLDAIVGVDTTDAAGGFGFMLPYAGTFHESFSKTGYRDTTISGIEVNIGDTTHVAVAMQTAAGTCQYAVGDANGNGSFNGLDVTYSVAYFKGGAPPPYECECTPDNTWYVAGDVNQSCSFNGLDVTYMVAYFKGGPSPNPCPDCPPMP
jgi:hypothetical protein